ncbi:MAG TPA: Hsp20/alpha crystallin family protein [Arenicellales bacterium]|nr:Hsp20/alpha crystallin family protein [Arenicellales bacterium]
MNELTRQPQSRSLWGSFDEFDNLFDDFWRPLRAGRSGPVANGAFAPALDVTESDNEYRVRADLPGVKKEDLDISMQDGVLTINAETRYEDEEKEKGRIIRQERRYGKFVRSMRFGDTVDVDNIKAEYKDGVLNLVLPKAEQVRPKRIDVQVS